jgi:hypothetical protein
MPDLRRQRRVVYHTKIRLRSPGREKSVVARVQNLSTSGVFVTATELPEAGTEVMCRMLVAGERCTFKGFVAWVRPQGAAEGGPGAGIQFVGVSDREAELLARLIQPDVSDRQSVDVWFEGMGAAIKSHASITDEALSISTKLPFLRLNSPVKVSFVRRGVEEVRSGILEAVTLEPSAEDGIPRLQVTVSTPLADSAYGTIDVPDTAPNATVPDEVLAREPRTVVSPMSIETPLPQVVAPPPAVIELPTAPVAPVTDGPPKDRDRTPRVLRPSEPTLVPPVPVVPTPPLRRELGQGTRIVMGMVTLGVVGTLGYLLADLKARPPQAEIAMEPMAAVAPERPKPIVVVPPAPPTPAPVIEKMDPPPPPEPDPGTMAIGLVGSTKGMQFYKLSEPPGLVINLPHGYPRPGARVPGAPFKRLSVQRKGQGSQLRVYFTLDQNADVTADGGGLKVVVRHKRPRKS